jgi:hypothetical protein
LTLGFDLSRLPVLHHAPVGHYFPAKVNEGAYTDGWMMKIKMSNPAELDDLMDAAQYEASCEH